MPLVTDARSNVRRWRSALVAILMAAPVTWMAAAHATPHAQPAPSLCEGWPSRPQAWNFCDDFESDGPMRARGRYFEYGDADGDFVPLDGVGTSGSRGMRARFREGAVGAGGMKLAFGRNPNGYMRSALRADEDFREIWYRMDLRMEPGWVGNPAKLSRATVFTERDDWSQAMIAHLWGDNEDHLLLDPVRCVDDEDRVKCRGYNDFEHMSWLGNRSGRTPIFATERSGSWYAIEAHVRLNDPGRSNGVHEFWIDGQLEARREGLNFIGGYTEHAINAIFFENYWNAGSPRDQERYFDNIVVSTQPIGDLRGVEPEASPPPAGPTATPTPAATHTPAATAMPAPSVTAQPLHLPALRRD